MRDFLVFYDPWTFPVEQYKWLDSFSIISQLNDQKLVLKLNPLSDVTVDNSKSLNTFDWLHFESVLRKNEPASVEHWYRAWVNHLIMVESCVSYKFSSCSNNKSRTPMTVTNFISVHMQNPSSNSSIFSSVSIAKCQNTFILLFTINLNFFYHSKLLFVYKWQQVINCTHIKLSMVVYLNDSLICYLRIKNRDMLNVIWQKLWFDTFS